MVVVVVVVMVVVVVLIIKAENSGVGEWELSHR